MSTENEIISRFSKLIKFAENQLYKIELTAQEQKIFDVLMNANKESGINAVLRCAGGWVRDRLLGKVSKDIDIAVDRGTGEQFASAVVKYMAANGIESKNVGVIKSNPDQSKHLETATTSIFGLPIDFVNLRSETYADSRIPEMKVGTPEEDAFRRDLSINALFYNINTGKIEDFTGKGIDDLKSGIIRTPLDPLQTFTDDPLRALRAIRFASRYGFALDPQLIEAAKSPEVKEALRNKISRERIAEELRGMLKGPNPALAFELVKALDLRDELFPRPANLDTWDMNQNTPYHDMGVYDHLVKVVDTMNSLLNKPGHDVKVEDRIVLLLAAFMHDLGKLEPSIKGSKQLGDLIVSTYNGHEEHSHRIAHHIMKELKMSNDEIGSVLRLLEPAGQLENMSRQMDKGIEPSRKFLGKLVQKLGDSWKHAIYLAMSDHTSKKKNEPALNEDATKNYYKLIDTIEKDQSLFNAHKNKPLLDGAEIAYIMNIKPGAAIGTIKNSLNDWQLSNSNATKQDAINFIRSHFAGKTEKELADMSPYHKKVKSTRQERLHKLAEMMGHLAVFKQGYLFLPVKRPELSAEEEKLVNGLKNRGEYHITIINKNDVDKLPKNTFEDNFRYEISGEPRYLGLGKVVDGGNTVYFIVVDWQEAQEFRAKYGLPPIDLHITIGFVSKDIHNVRKNKVLKEGKCQSGG